METQTQPTKLLTREEFEEDMKVQKECYDTLRQYKDFEQWKEYFNFELISYETYLERYEKYYNEEENKITTNTIDEE